MQSPSCDFSYLYERQRFGIRAGLEGIQAILEKLGNPQKKIPVIHVAGTNGKGSVASLIAGILQAAGLKVGLYTSPHLIHFRERFRVGGKNPDDARLFSLAKAVESVENPEEPATFFELTTAMAFLLFKEEKVDFAVMETGMGGRWDATNAAESEISVITTISLEHTEILGNTLKAIAGEKAGIIRKNIPVITGVREKEALKVIQKQTEKLSSSLKIIDEDFSIKEEENGFFTYQGKKRFLHLKPGLSGIHQAMNMALALAALESLSEKRKDLILSEKIIQEGVLLQNWPARTQILCEKPMVILDGAHNEAGAKALAGFIKTLDHAPKILVFGVLSDKNASKMLQDLAPLFSEIIFTKPESERSRNPEELPAFLPTEKMNSIVEKPEEAFSCAMKKCPENGLLCIAGSLFLAGDALRFFSPENLLSADETDCTEFFEEKETPHGL